jgi:hypothetical protein
VAEKVRATDPTTTFAREGAVHVGSEITGLLARWRRPYVSKALIVSLVASSSSTPSGHD